jgi:protein TonB
MVAHVDTLDQRESLGRPMVISAAMHAGLFSFIAISTSLGLHGHVLWGNPHSLGGGGSVGIQAVKQLPMPVRSGAANPLANDTESRVPQPPKPEPRKARAPEPDAIPIRGREAPRKPTYMRSQQYAQYRPGQQKPNQLYSDKGQALSSNMFGGVQGTGGVQMGTGGSFGSRFGAYRDLLEQRVGQKWRTDEVDPRIQTAPAVIVTFEIQRNGSATNVRILQGSGIRPLDYSALRAISDAAPFPPLPQGYDRNSAQIEFWFQLKR